MSSNSGDELPFVDRSARELFLVCLRLRRDLLETITKKLVLIFVFFFFGWRLCVVDVCVCVRARELLTALTRLVALTFLSATFLRFTNTWTLEPRLKPPAAADWTVLFQLFFFNFNFSIIFISNFRVKRQANEGFEKILYYSCYLRFFYIHLPYLVLFLSEAKLKLGEKCYSTLVRAALLALSLECMSSRSTQGRGRS